MGRWTIGALATMALSCAALRAAALALPPSGVPILVNGDVPLAPDGVLIFEQDTGSFPLEDASILVQDDLGREIVGHAEGVDVDLQPLATREPGLWLWRPDAPWPLASHFTVTTSNPSTGESGIATFVTAPGPRERAVDRAWLQLKLAARPIDHGSALTCCERDDGGLANCFAPELVLEPGVEVTPDPSITDSGTRQLLFRSTAIEPGSMAQRSAFAEWPLTLSPILFDQQRDRYCVGIEIFDAVTHSLSELTGLCLPNEAELFEGTVAKTDEQLAGSLNALGCQRPPEGFEPAWCLANQSQCFSRDAYGCQHFAELCPEYPREPGQQGPGAVGAGDADGGDVDGGDEAGAGSASGSGCAVRTARPSGVAWLVPLAGWLAARRARRAAKRTGATRS